MAASTVAPLYRLVSLALFALVLRLSPVSSQQDPNAVLRFYPLSLSAPWSPRWDSNMEWYPHELAFTPVNAQGVPQNPVRWSGRVMIVQGNANSNPRTNDVWASSDQGYTWYLIAGRAGNVSAAFNSGASSFTLTLSRAATGVDSRQRIYRIGGSDANGALYSSVWMSTNGGLSWVDQSTRLGAAPIIPARQRSSIMFDAQDNVYIIGGEVRLSDHLMTSTGFKSTDQGITWQNVNPTPWNPRGSGIFLSHTAPKLGVEILTYFTGWDGRVAGLYNEVWVSSDMASSWSRIKSNWGDGLPPFKARDAANAEVTKSGVMILVGGQAEESSTRRETLNDVWVSMDGGYSWGLCAEDATFADRRDVLTMLDDDGFLYVAGGTDYDTGATFNDVWRSSFSFNNLTAVRVACGGVRAPACGAGLTCWPQDPKTTFYSNGTVTCPASRECAGLVDAFLDFDVQTPAAPYRARWAANAEFFPLPISYVDVRGTRRTAPAGSLVVSGGAGDGVSNDVWVSADFGLSWALVAGYAVREPVQQLTKAYGTQAESSFWPVRSESTGIVDHKQGFIYRIGGYGGGAAEVNDVWRTTNAVTWQRMQALGLPPLSASNVVVDDRGKLYVAGGVVSARPQSIFMVSTTNGSSFYSPSPLPPPFMRQYGRAKAFLLHRRSPRLARDILFYGSGWNGTFMFNDVWASSDEGVSWTVVCAAAPFEPRDAAAAEITEEGLIVMGGGQVGGYTMNDVWVSPDGGFTWSACSSEAYWPDRREMSTAMDADDYFYILNGRATANSDTRVFNDVYRSSISFKNPQTVRAACNINVPACGVGMTCWPGAAGTVVTPTGVTCPALQVCQQQNARLASSSTAVRRSSSSSTARPRPPPTYDPCDDWPVTDDTCWNYVWSSSGAGNVKPSGLTSWAIGGIVVLVAAVVGGVALFLYKRWKGSQPAGQQTKTTHAGTGENLLGEGETSSSDYTRA